MLWTSHAIVGQMLSVFETKRVTPRQGNEHSLSSFNVTPAFLRIELMPLTSATECLMGDSFTKCNVFHPPALYQVCTSYSIEIEASFGMMNQE
jgi:hypothetical protein